LCVAQPVFDTASFVNHLEVADADCCFDYSGDDLPDNALAGLLDLVAGLMEGMDVNEEIQAAIDDGTLAVLQEFGEVEDWTDDDSLYSNQYMGAVTDDDYADNLDPATAGEFLATLDSFDDTGAPLVIFEGMSISGGLMAGGPFMFMLEIPISDLGIVLNTTVEGVLMTGEISASGDTPVMVSINDGQLGGYVHKNTIFGALNDFAESACDCLGLDGPMVDIETLACVTAATPGGCTSEENNPCGEVYGFCDMLGMIAIILDIDSDDDGEMDSISLGILFTSIPAQIVGIADAEL